MGYALWAGPWAEVTDSEQLLVESYHQQLVKELGRQAETEHVSMDLDTFKHQYRMAFLDLCRVIMADHWKTVTLATLRTRAALPDSKRKVFNAYNKDEEVARRLLRRLMAELDSLEDDSAWE